MNHLREHLTDTQVIGYIHHTLTDAQREAFDQHLSACPACRARLEEHQATADRLRADLRGELQEIAPPPTMTFAAIAPRLKRRRRGGWLRIESQFFPGLATVAGLVLVLLTWTLSIQTLAGPRLTIAAPIDAPYPALACLLFVVPVVANYKEQSLLQRRAFIGPLAFLLWLGTAALGLYEIFVIREIFFQIFARCSQNYGLALALGNWGVMLLAAVWIAAFIGGGEYHYRRLGTRASWSLFGWTIGIELAILLIAFLI
ncbi:MAG: anti-sigma factor family protein [Anaerolineales bacterium]